MRSVKLTIAFDGSGFAGYELQPGQRTVRSELARALKKLYNQPLKFDSSSRTDAGVHAAGLVISYQPPFAIPLPKLPLALNAQLPDDIRIIGASASTSSARGSQGPGTRDQGPGSRDQGSEFNARFDAKSKTYEYLIFNGHIMPPAIRKFAWQVKPKLDISAMKKAANFLIGQHDFSSFCAAGGDDTDFVRTIFKCGVWNVECGIWADRKVPLISIRVTGNGFLYKMVRNIVGTLVEVGLGRREPGEIKKILSAKDRRRAGKTAPAQGLCLVRVDY